MGRQVSKGPQPAVSDCNICSAPISEKRVRTIVRPLVAATVSRRLAHSAQTPYLAYTGKSPSLSESCSQNENVPNFSFLIIGSADAAGRHDFDLKTTFVVLAGASAPAFRVCAR